MSQFIISKILENQLDDTDIQIGQILYCIDTEEIYYDAYANIRSLQTSIIPLDTEAEKDSIEPSLQHLYLVLETEKVYKYTDRWVRVFDTMDIASITGNLEELAPTTLTYRGTKISPRTLSDTVYMNNGKILTEVIAYLLEAVKIEIVNDSLNVTINTGDEIRVLSLAKSKEMYSLIQGLQNTISTCATVSDLELKLAELVGSSPETLNTLNELASALGDDPNFATTITNRIGLIEGELLDLETEVDNKLLVLNNTVNTLKSNFETAMGDDPNFALTVNLQLNSINENIYEMTQDINELKEGSGGGSSSGDIITMNLHVDINSISEIENGSFSSPYKSISNLVDNIPSNLNNKIINIYISDGIYDYIYNEKKELSLGNSKYTGKINIIGSNIDNCVLNFGLKTDTSVVSINDLACSYINTISDNLDINNIKFIPNINNQISYAINISQGNTRINNCQIIKSVNNNSYISAIIANNNAIVYCGTNSGIVQEFAFISDNSIIYTDSNLIEPYYGLKKQSGGQIFFTKSEIGNAIVAYVNKNHTEEIPEGQTYTGTGSINHPFLNISDAISLVLNDLELISEMNITLYITPGLYNEHVDISNFINCSVNITSIDNNIFEINNCNINKSDNITISKCKCKSLDITDSKNIQINNVEVTSTTIDSSIFIYNSVCNFNFLTINSDRSGINAQYNSIVNINNINLTAIDNGLITNNSIIFINESNSTLIVPIKYVNQQGGRILASSTDSTLAQNIKLLSEKIAKPNVKEALEFLKDEQGVSNTNIGNILQYLSSVYNKTEVNGLITNFITSSAVDTKIASLVDSAPGTLDTLNEIATALGNDPNFSTTIINLLSTKIDTTQMNTAISAAINDNITSVLGGSY